MNNNQNMKFLIDLDEMSARERFVVSKNLPGFRNYREGKRQAFTRESELQKLFFLLSLHHFGVEPSIPSRDVLELGVSLARDYFEGDWWTEHPRDVAQLSRCEGNEDFEWFAPFRLAFLFASLLPDSRLVQTLGKWPENWMKPEGCAVPFPVGIEQLYFLLINRASAGQVATSVDCVGDERIRRLYRALEDSTECSVSSAMNESLQLFASSLTNKELLPYQAIAIEETVIVASWRRLYDVDPSQEVEAELQQHLLLSAAQT